MISAGETAIAASPERRPSAAATNAEATASRSNLRTASCRCRLLSAFALLAGLVSVSVGSVVPGVGPGPRRGNDVGGGGGGGDGGKNEQIKRHEYKKTDYGALVLDSTNFRDSVERFKFLVVLFYAPWCPHSQRFLKAYRKITSRLSEEKADVVISEVDGSTDLGNPLIKSENIEFYPTVVLFRKGSRIFFKGEKAESNVLEWIRGLTSPHVVRYSRLEDAVALLNAERNVVMAFVKGAGTWGAELFADATIGNRHAGTVKAVVELDDDVDSSYFPAGWSSFPGGNDTLVLLRKQGRGGGALTWAKIPIDLVARQRRTSIIRLPGAEAEAAGGGGGGGQMQFNPEDEGGGGGGGGGGPYPAEMPMGAGGPGEGQQGESFQLPADAINFMNGPQQ